MEYVKSAKANKSQKQCIETARARYAADFANYELDKIRGDIIFSSIADDYFEFMQSINGVNDIVKIGEILATLY